MISDVKCRENVNIQKIPRCDWLASGHFRLTDLFIEYLKSCIVSHSLDWHRDHGTIYHMLSDSQNMYRFMSEL